MSWTYPGGWIPEGALHGAPAERAAVAALVHVAADLVKRGGKLLDLGRAIANARTDLDAVLLSYRVERALVRRALKLSPTATLDEVLAALQSPADGR